MKLGKANNKNDRIALDRKRLQKNILFFSVFALSFLYVLWRLFFTLPFHHGTASMIWGVILWVAESSTTIETFSHFYNVWRLKLPDLPVIPDEMYPDVDILICTHNESEELLFKTLNGCNYLEYPDKSKVHVYLCDDANRPGVAELAQRMGVGYYGFDGNKHAKAGNINYAFFKTHSPLVAIFDADMIPATDFLMETVPYFFLRDMVQEEDGSWRKRTEEDGPSERKELGYVQTQQSFYNPDPLQRNLYMERNAPNEQDYFYRAVNVARTHVGSAAFAGSNTVFSRKALEEVGGLATYSITEDLATSIPILSAGYTSMAVDKELAHGLSPEDAFSFIKQRQRWSRGSAQVIPTKRFLHSKLPLKTKWSFAVSYLYWWTFARRLVFILCPIVYGLFNIAVANVPMIQLICLWLPYYLIYNMGLRRMSGNTINALWSSIIDTVQFPYLIWPIIAGTIKIPEKKFWVTPKDKIKGRNSSVKLAIPHIILTVLSLISGVICIHNIFVDHYGGAIIVLFWLCYNLFTLIMGIVYYCGRVNKNDYEKIPANLHVAMDLNGKSIEGATVYVAENSLAVLLTDPEYLPYDSDFFLAIADRNYAARLKVSVDHVQKVLRGWRYTLTIKDMAQRDEEEYMQILYDRPHSFARTSNVSMAILVRNIYHGIRSRQKSGRMEKRRLANINFKEPLFLPSLEAGDVEVASFNYESITIKGSALPEKLTLRIGDGANVHCVLASDVANRKGVVTYRIENWKELASNPTLAHLLHSAAEKGRTATSDVANSRLDNMARDEYGQNRFD